MYDVVILKDKEEILEHERLLYNSFIKLRWDDWMDANYQVINKDRLKPIISYDNQIIIGAKIDKKLKTSLAINVNSKEKMQFEYIGFSREKINSLGCIGEVLSLCSVDVFAFIYMLKKLDSILKDKLKEYGIKELYGTCCTKYKKFYEKIGLYVIDEIPTDYDNELLLRKVVV